MKQDFTITARGREDFQMNIRISLDVLLGQIRMNYSEMKHGVLQIQRKETLSCCVRNFSGVVGSTYQSLQISTNLLSPLSYRRKKGMRAHWFDGY